LTAKELRQNAEEAGRDPSEASKTVIANFVCAVNEYNATMYSENIQQIMDYLEKSDGTLTDEQWSDQSRLAMDILSGMRKHTGSILTDLQTRNKLYPLAEKLDPAIPHMEVMLEAIQNRDMVTALEHGRAALAALSA
jgi:hypothetical protein